MQTILSPYVMQCVESACRRKAATVSLEMKRGVTGFASVAVTASLMGIAGNVFGMMSSFRSVTGSKSTVIAGIARNLSESLITTLGGLLLAMAALLLYRHLTERLAEFNMEMENQSVDLVNRLVVYLRRMGNTQEICFSAASRKHLHRTRSLAPFRMDAMEATFEKREFGYRNGLLEMVWPTALSEFEARGFLHRGLWVASVCAAWGLAHFGSGGVATALGALLMLAGAGIQAKFYFPAVLVFGLTICVNVGCIWLFRFSPWTLFLALVTPSLVGSAKATWWLMRNRLPMPRYLRIVSGLIALLGLGLMLLGCAS